MPLHSWTAGDTIEENDINGNFSLLGQKTIGIKEVELGENIDTPKAVYIKASDGLLYKTDSDNFDEKILSFAGIIGESGITGETKPVIQAGKVGGFSGLTAGQLLNLAKAGTSQQSSTAGNDSTGVSNDIGTATNTEVAPRLITSAVGLLNNFRMKFQISGSPTGNVLCYLVKQLPTVLNTGDALAVASVPIASISAGVFVEFDFGGIRLEPGTYYFRVRLESSQTAGNYLSVRASGTDSSVFSQTNGGGFGQPRTNFEREFNFEGSTFATGDLTTYFYDYPKTVARAISATEIELLMDHKNIGVSSTLARNTLYTASQDGFLCVFDRSSGSNLAFDIYVDGAEIATWNGNVNANEGGITLPIRKGQTYSIVAGADPDTMIFIPLY